MFKTSGVFEPSPTTKRIPDDPSAGRHISLNGNAKHAKPPSPTNGLYLHSPDCICDFVPAYTSDDALRPSLANTCGHGNCPHRVVILGFEDQIRRVDVR
jgi:hypothetical protein